jgi:hypothetical protein
MKNKKNQPFKIKIHGVLVVYTHTVAVHVGRGGACGDVGGVPLVIDSGGGVEGADPYIVVVGEGGAIHTSFLSTMEVSVSEGEKQQIVQYEQKQKTKKTCIFQITGKLL